MPRAHGTARVPEAIGRQAMANAEAPKATMQMARAEARGEATDARHDRLPKMSNPT